MSFGISVLDHLFQGDGFTVAKSGFITVRKDVTTETLVEVIHKLNRLNTDTEKLHKITAIATGSLVLEHAARHRCSLSESTDVLDICRDFDVAKKTVLEWAKIVSMIAEPILACQNLTISHLKAAVSFAGPSDPKLYSKFARERDLMLCDINEDPHDKGKRFVEDKMRCLKEKYGVKPMRQEPIGHILKKLVWGFRLMRLKREVREQLLAKVGLTEPDLYAYIKSWEDELIVRKQIPDDVTNVEISWHSKTPD